jgi:hypothetical protein
MTDREHRANEANRLLSEINPYLDALEREAFEDATRVKWWHPFGQRTVRRCLERVSVIRDLRSRIRAIIASGKVRANQ